MPTVISGDVPRESIFAITRVTSQATPQNSAYLFTPPAVIAKNMTFGDTQGKIAIPESGVYQITVNMKFLTSTDLYNVYVNGVSKSDFSSPIGIPGSTVFRSVVNLLKNDFVTIVNLNSADVTPVNQIDNVYVEVMRII